jgi:CIC family chloride channel protein
MHTLPALESKLIASTAPGGSAEERRVNLFTLCGLALVIGVMTGFGAVAFRALIALVHNASYSGRLSFVYDANIPKERHINLYLVKQAQDIMETGFIVARAGTTLKDAMLPDGIDDVRPIVVEREGRIVGLIPPRSGLWLEARTNPDVRVEKFVESRLVVCRDEDLLSMAFARLKRHRAGAAVVFRGTARPRIGDVVGIITKRAIADAVIDSYED